MKTNSLHRFLFLALALSLSCVGHGTEVSCRRVVSRTKGSDWLTYAGNDRGEQYSPLNQVNKSNVGQLKPLWRWTSPDMEILVRNQKIFTMVNEARPLAIDGDLFVSTSLSQVARIDGVTGKTVWKYNPISYLGDIPPNLGFVHRGVSYWRSKDGKDRRIIYGTGDGYLIALDLRTGKPISTFGDNGRVDLMRGLARDGKDWKNRWQYSVTSPPSISRDTIIIGSSIDDIVKTDLPPPGDVRAFDVRTGQLKWRFKTIPQAGEFGNETWPKGSAEKNGQANVWTVMSVDQKLGYAYLPVSTPTNDYLGSNRPGDGLFGESLVCVDCKTGKRVWHFQLVHHGVWDYDPPAAPNLSDVYIDGKLRQIVSLVTKQGFTYVFDRVTGQPVWPINETPVPQSIVEVTSPTQPIPTKPPPFDRQGINSPDDFLSPEAKKVADQYYYGGVYTPPTGVEGLGNNQGKETKGTIILPGNVGGASWAGAANHPELGMLIIPSITGQHVGFIEKDANGNNRYAVGKGSVLGLDGKTPYALPLFKPPYGRLTAIDLSTGTIKWQVPMGRGPRDNPEVQKALEGTEWENRDLGDSLRGHLVLTPELLFVAQIAKQTVVGLSEKRNAIRVSISEKPEDQNIKVYDPLTGAHLHTIDTMIGAPAGASGNAQGGMVTFLNREGKQRFAVPVGGANMPAELLILGLPD